MPEFVILFRGQLSKRKKSYGKFFITARFTINRTTKLFKGGYPLPHFSVDRVNDSLHVV